MAPASVATALTSSTMRRLRLKFSPVKRGLVLRQSSLASSPAERIVPVSKPWPNGEVAILDASGWHAGADMHRDIAAALDFPDYYGNNLDALND